MIMSQPVYALRSITVNDFEFIYQVKKEAYQAYVEMNYGGWDEELQRSLFESFMDAYGMDIHIITIDGADIGFYNARASERRYELGNICIIPAFQRRGIGTAILTSILSEQADKIITLQCFKQNPVGNLYRRLGFRLSGETAYHYRMERAPQ